MDNTGGEMRHQFLKSVSGLSDVEHLKQFMLDSNADKVSGDMKTMDVQTLAFIKEKQHDEITPNIENDDLQELVVKKRKTVGFLADGVTIATDTCDTSKNKQRDYNIGSYDNYSRLSPSPEKIEQKDSLDDLVKVKSKNQDAISRSTLTRNQSEPFLMTEKMRRMRDAGLVHDDC